MLLKRKILLSFIISASIIAALVVFEYINYVEMRKEITYLELTDTIRSKSLQLRRHEKNFFLYSPQKSAEESGEVHRYLNELDGILKDNLRTDRTGRLDRLEGLLGDYKARFDRIEANSKALLTELETARSSNRKNDEVYKLIGLTFLERPLEGAEFIENSPNLPHDKKMTVVLREMDSDISGLRKTGEDIIAVSKDLDSTARKNVERSIHLSQVAILVIFPLFFLVGVGTLFFITGNITVRLRMLTDVVEKAGKGDHPYVPAVFRKLGAKDEVGVLIEKFNHMEEELVEREHEIARKNEEILHAKKLSAIGTLASGVAHELNNPLNNIYLSAQVLEREIKEDYPPAVKEVVGDIIGQTARVKRIVGDLLEFARGREPSMQEVDVVRVINEVYGLVSTTTTYGTEGVRFSLKTFSPAVRVTADLNHMERVFINLFTNAVDAMEGRGDLTVEVTSAGDTVCVTVTDSGAGIAPDDLQKIFEPFFSTKDKGTGLGLAIVFNIVKRHGGEITVKSEKGKGATFRLTLPKGGL